MNVTVDEDGSFVIVSGNTARCTGERVVDGSFRAGVIEFFPHCGDEIDEPATLVGTCRQASVTRRSPNSSGDRGEDLQALNKW